MKVLRNKSVEKDSKSTLCYLNWSFPELRLKLLTRVAVNMFRKVSSCSSCVEPKTMMSSMIPVTLGIFLSSNLRWKMSWDTTMPNGRRLNL